MIATNKTLGYDIDMQRVEQKLYVLLVCELIPPDGIERSNTTNIHSCTSCTGELLSVARSTSSSRHITHVYDTSFSASMCSRHVSPDMGKRSSERNPAFRNFNTKSTQNYLSNNSIKGFQTIKEIQR